MASGEDPDERPQECPSDPAGRALPVSRIVEVGLRPAEAAQAAGVSSRPPNKWLRRFEAEGWAGLEAGRHFRKVAIDLAA